MKKVFALVLVLLFAMLVGVSAFAEEEYTEEVYPISVIMETTGNVNVREWARIDGPIFCTLDKGTSVEVLRWYSSSDGRIWAGIRVHDGSEFNWGFISMKYLELADDFAYEFNFDFNLARMMEVTGGSVFVREYESIDADVTTTVHRGDVVEVEEYVLTNDGRMWASCLNQDGEYLGWISMKYLVEYIEVAEVTENVAEVAVG